MNDKKDAFSHRLRAALGPGSVHAFSEKSGVGDTLMRKYLAGSIPGLDKAALIARAAGVSLEWLATGQGRMLPDAPGGDDDFVQVPFYDQRAAAGYGAAAADEPPASFFSFRRDWVRATLGGDPARLAILPASGDSMEPLIHEGDLLLIDLSVTVPAGVGIYVMERGGDLLVKSVHPLLSGGLIVDSLNKAYAVEAWSPGKDHGLRFVGRVRMISRAV